MVKRIVILFLIALVAVSGVPFAMAQDKANEPPVIAHQPVTAAVRDQSISVLAKVTDDSAQVKSVTLFYSVSKDAAPFRVPMKLTGSSTYFGTIPANVISGTGRISYYIEALDFYDAATETPWYTVEIKEPGSVKKPVAAVSEVQPSAGTGEEPKMSKLTIGLIAGGAALVAGGALIAANQGGGGGGSGSSSSTVQAGSFAGTSTECSTPQGGTAACSTHGIDIEIGSQGTVSSSDLRSGMPLSANLRGSDFAFVALVADSSGTGEVVYTGTVVSDQILGDITGTLQTPAGKGTSSGTFSAKRK